MTLWVGKDNLLPYGMVIILCAYFIIRQINNLLNLYKDAAGMWHEDRWRPLLDFGAVLGALRYFNLHHHCYVGGGYALADP